MLKDRILSTLKFFNLQGVPLTLLDLHKYLLNEPDTIRTFLDENWEIKPEYPKAVSWVRVGCGEILACLENECHEEVVFEKGFYVLKGQEGIIRIWNENYLFGLKREKLIKKYLPGLRHLPFIRGVAVLGSQAFGLYKRKSDIDLLILIQKQHMWLARFLVAAYFQIFAKRRHGKYVANRFCLNHFVIAGKVLDKDLNLYTASEYLKMRPEVLISGIEEFQSVNSKWINFIFPNLKLPLMYSVDVKSRLQSVFERFLSGRFGEWLENSAKKIQHGRINTGEFIMATDEELSFHPDNRKRELFANFFEN